MAHADTTHTDKRGRGLSSWQSSRGAVAAGTAPPATLTTGTHQPTPSLIQKRTRGTTSPHRLLPRYQGANQQLCLSGWSKPGTTGTQGHCVAPTMFPEKGPISPVQDSHWERRAWTRSCGQTQSETSGSMGESTVLSQSVSVMADKKGGNVLD